MKVQILHWTRYSCRRRYYLTRWRVYYCGTVAVYYGILWVSMRPVSLEAFLRYSAVFNSPMSFLTIFRYHVQQLTMKISREYIKFYFSIRIRTVFLVPIYIYSKMNSTSILRVTYLLFNVTTPVHGIRSM